MKNIDVLLYINYLYKDKEEINTIYGLWERNCVARRQK